MKIQFKLQAAAVAVALSLLSSTAVMAASIPEASKFDSRIKTVLYNPDDVTVILTRPGNTTLVQLEVGEYLVKLPTGGLSIGDSEAWTIGVRGNNIFFKPKDTFPETNINLVTNRRTYALELIETTDKAKAAWQVRYRYPAVPKPYKEPVADNGPCSDGPMNRNYFKYGNQDLSPTEVWDDGRFTCMRFPTSKPLPNVYRYTPNSELKEGTPATHMKDDVLVIHETSDEFRLRIGNSVLGIKTDSLRPAPYNWKRTTTGETRVILNAK
jgi:type IV secretion system protein VirB9